MQINKRRKYIAEKNDMVRVNRGRHSFIEINYSKSQLREAILKCHAVAELQVFVNYVILLHPPEYICITPADVSAQEFTFYFSNFFRNAFGWKPISECGII